MLKGNLSTRPFYNERLVSLVLALIAVVALALTAFNLLQVFSLSSERSALRAQIDADTAEAERIRAEASVVQQTIDRPTLNALLVSTREANRLIDQRAFSWTLFFDYIEKTLPIGVRLVAVAPRVDRDELIIGMNVVARTWEDLEAFTDNLNGTGAFRDVFVTVTDDTDDGTIGATLDTGYEPVSPPAAAPSAEGGEGVR